MVMNQMFQLMKQLTAISDPQKIAYMRQLQREMKKRDVLSVPFNDLHVVVMDVETTGFFPYKGDRLLSIGAVKMKGDQVLQGETFYSLIYYEEGPSVAIEELTGITKEALLEAPPLNKVLRDFFRFVKSDTLVAHHANHEKQFMQHAAWSSLKTNFQHRIIDTSFLTKIVEPESILVTLDECCEHYGITIEQRHHAFYDALATAKLWAASVRAIQDKGFSNLQEVYTHIATSS
ncbi:exonuclease domain-containing protein [Aquibacillus sp. 3ASR75-11]|uniref:Exonuclease domain-containing protein n=1 Tax=Terrihalobacillus insolitus TaxID=2950438 RepID=A0A9X3WPC8_9BACI|nr:exonuclease domain-containing protein [Terrihalobacillus insolitus]MDC3411949.1 exonuclease domain-containing protein [Terrihalobacillus insolitus]MDC3423365.1 exonuclease domain-containing protein [Terrihalobacillus insolitus]